MSSGGYLRQGAVGDLGSTAKRAATERRARFAGDFTDHLIRRVINSPAKDVCCRSRGNANEANPLFSRALDLMVVNGV